MNRIDLANDAIDLLLGYRDKYDYELLTFRDRWEEHMKYDKETLAHRRRIEDKLLSLGSEREEIELRIAENRRKLCSLVGPAQEAGISIRDIALIVRVSRQTIQDWLKQ